MGFLKLNRRKIFWIFCLCLFIWSGIGLIGYLIVRSHHPEGVSSDEMQILFTLVYGAAMAFFLVYFFSGWYNFYKERRLLSNVLFLKIFDNNEYSMEYTRRKWWLFYTLECAYGKISGYPTVVLVDITIAKHSTTRVLFHVFIKKFNKVRPELFFYEMENNELPEHIKGKVFDFIAALKSKGYDPGNVSNGQEAADMIATL